MFNTCEKCGSTETAVSDSRIREDCIYRRRWCRECGERYSTREIRVEEYESLLLKIKSLNEQILVDRKALEEKFQSAVEPLEAMVRSIVKSYLSTLTGEERNAFFEVIKIDGEIVDGEQV